MLRSHSKASRRPVPTGEYILWRVPYGGRTPAACFHVCLLICLAVSLLFLTLGIVLLLSTAASHVSRAHGHLCFLLWLDGGETQVRK